jgi:hypothetical protein
MWRWQDVAMKSIMALAIVCLSVLAGAAAEAHKLSETRSTLEKWVEARQLISRTRADWQGDKETIEQTARMIERELKDVEEKFSKLATNNAQVEKERSEAEASIKSSHDAITPAQQFATEFEAKLRAFVPRLPVPLQDILKPLLARLPADAATTKMKAWERVQVLIGILNELDKFNNGVTIFSEKRKNDKGAEVSVETVYVGLGAAYFVNDAGDFAGVGSPGTAGWEWSTRPELAGHVREVIRIYRNERPAKFVSLPVAIK